ncbi:hypothetical protein [Sphingobacterium sp. LRF_L2]|uniref:hypothetical protein n=1 Tax=Sphingobacterium sp. LRF_L2 TaxID=3369421 RepID=UPI003F60C0C8
MKNSKFKGLFASLTICALLAVGTLSVAHAGEKDKEKKEEPKKAVLVNPQWFTYTANPNSVNFATEKMNPANYSSTGISDQDERPCNDANEFCGIYAETVTLAGQSRPDLSSAQPVYTALQSYSNGSGPSDLIDEKQSQ